MLNIRTLQTLWVKFIVPTFPSIVFVYCFWPNVPDLIFKLIKLFVYCIALFAISSQPKKFLYFATRDPFLVALTFLAYISYFWSATPTVTLATARNLVVLYFAAVYIAMNYDLNQQMKHFAWILGALSCLSLILPIVNPAYGRHGVFWVGVFRHKNRLANAMIMSILVFLNLHLLNREKKIVYFLIPLLSSIPLILSQGRAALIALFACLSLFLIYWSMSQKDHRSKVILSILVIYSFLALSLGIYFSLEFIVVGLLGRDLTLTGRTDMWSYLIERLMTRPLLGFGYGGFWKNPDESLGVFRNQPWFLGALEGRGNAHSGYVELLLHLGLIGFILLFISLIVTIFRVSYVFLKTQKVEFFWALQYIFLLVLLNITETNEAWLGNFSIGWLLYMTISICSIKEQQKLRQTRNCATNPYLVSTSRH